MLCGFGLSTIQSVPNRKAYNLITSLGIVTYFYGYTVFGAIGYSLILLICMHLIPNRVTACNTTNILAWVIFTAYTINGHILSKELMDDLTVKQSMMITLCKMTATSMNLRDAVTQPDKLKSR